MDWPKNMSSKGQTQRARNGLAAKLWKKGKLLTVRIIVRFVHLVLKGLPLRQDVILFESFPELDGSPRMIYDELVRRGMDRRYKLVWAVDAAFKAPAGFECVPFFGELELPAQLHKETVLAKAKAIVEGNRFVKKLKKSSYRIFTRHGGPIKNCDLYFSDMGELDCCLSLSPNLLDAERKHFSGKPPRFVHLGYPAHDALFDARDLYSLGFWEKLTGRSGRFAKIIGWMPTYRQHRMASRRDDDTPVFPFGVPLLWKHEDFHRLNELLARENILLAIQMHHAQAGSFPREHFSNIVTIEQSVKEALGISNACMMQGFDALITDYSGAYMEFILLDRPIAISIDDYETYAAKNGFTIDFFEWIKGEYLKTAADLEHFVENVARGRDVAREERRDAMQRIHNHLDNQSTKRVTDLLCAEAGLVGNGKEGNG